MLKVVQLMIALELVWLMMTLLVPAPWIVAEPPTTVPPAGPAETGVSASRASASSAVVVSSSLRVRGCIAMVPLEPAGQDDEESVVGGQAVAHALLDGLGDGQRLLLDHPRDREVSGYRVQPSQA